MTPNKVNNNNNGNTPLVVIPQQPHRHGYGSAGESPVPSSTADSGSTSPLGSSYSPGLCGSNGDSPTPHFDWPCTIDSTALVWEFDDKMRFSTSAAAGRLPVFARLSQGAN
jgi:hypothetical protein